MNHLNPNSLLIHLKSLNLLTNQTQIIQNCIKLFNVIFFIKIIIRKIIILSTLIALIVIVQFQFFYLYTGLFVL